MPQRRLGEHDGTPFCRMPSTMSVDSQAAALPGQEGATNLRAVFLHVLPYSRMAVWKDKGGTDQASGDFLFCIGKTLRKGIMLQEK